MKYSRAFVAKTCINDKNLFHKICLKITTNTVNIAVTMPLRCSVIHEN